MTNQAYLRQIPEVARLLDTADVIDIKSVEVAMTLREFIAAFISYQPNWMRFLFRVRGSFAHLFGMRHVEIPSSPRVRPEDVAMQPGEKTMFTVRQAEEDRYWIAGEDDSHLNFDVIIVPEPLDGPLTRYYVTTLVRYNNWTGRLYFAVIAPFHHLIVHWYLGQVAKQATATRHKRSRERTVS